MTLREWIEREGLDVDRVLDDPSFKTGEEDWTGSLSINQGKPNCVVIGVESTARFRGPNAWAAE